MKIAYVTTYNARDIRNWSGLGYYIKQALENQLLSLKLIGPLEEKCSLLFKARECFCRCLLNKKYLRDREPVILKHYARQVSDKLRFLKPDIIFSPGTVPIAYLEHKKPIAFWTDATFAGNMDFYPYYSNLCKRSIEDGNKMERLTLQKSALAIYSSDWAAQTAIDYYKVDKSKVKVVPFGANIEAKMSFEDIKNIVNSRPRNKCKLLFIGVDWSRKGGDAAVEVTRQLNKAGLESELTVVGCRPILKRFAPKFVKFLGFIPKTTRQGLDKIKALLAESHFLILPSKAECTAIVLCEANLFGVPCITTDVGGIPAIIKNNLNGKAFSRDSDVSEYCAYIINLFSDYSQYKNLALSSFNEYQSRLNWSVAGRAVKRLLAELTC